MVIFGLEFNVSVSVAEFVDSFINLNSQRTAEHLTLLLLNTTCPLLANSVDPDQLASEEAN